MADDPLRDRYPHLILSDRDLKIYEASSSREPEGSQLSLFEGTWRDPEQKSSLDQIATRPVTQRETSNERNETPLSNTPEIAPGQNEEFKADFVREGQPLVEAQREREMSWTQKMEASESKALNSRDSLMFASAGQSSRSWANYIDPSKDPMATARSLGLEPQMDRMEANHRKAIANDRGEGREA